MTGFGLRTLGATAQKASYAARLEVAEPFLDHHRPGGDPLLGTAMGISLLTDAAHRMLAERVNPSSLTQVLDLRIGPSLVVPVGTAAVDVVVDLVIDTRPLDAAATFGELRSAGSSTTGAPHFAGAVTVRPCRPDRQLAAIARPAGSVSAGVDAADVYALFFHGPAFRVVADARLVGETMVCELARGLPALRRGDADPPWPGIDPCWIELGMQAAGLHEIATRRRMMIPSRIDRIEQVQPADRPAADRLWAEARRNGNDASFTVDVVDAGRTPWLRIEGYESRPLPFPADQSAIDALAAAFGRS